MDDRTAEPVVLRLKEISRFSGPDWNFRICSETKQLLNQPIPDILVISRLLPGMEAILEKVRKRFVKPRTIFLIDRVNERGKAFMRKAEALGFKPNFVTGDLPGDRPYLLPLALLQDYEEVVGQQGFSSKREVSESAVIVTMGAVSPTNNIRVLPARKAADVQKLAYDKNIDAVVVASGHKDAENCIMMVRRRGFTGSVLVFGDYAPELIALGATGCISDPVEIVRYVAISRALEKK